MADNYENKRKYNELSAGGNNEDSEMNADYRQSPNEHPVYRRPSEAPQDMDMDDGQQFSDD